MLLGNIQRGLEEEAVSVEQLVAAVRVAYLKTDEAFIALGVRDGACVVTGCDIVRVCDHIATCRT